MAKQKAFFLSEWEIYQQEHPERFTRKKGSSKRRSTTKIYNCETCGLDKTCNHPKIKRYGTGQKDILVVGLCPGYVEDGCGIPFKGPAGSLAKRMFNLVGIDFDLDCERMNIVACYPGKNKKGKDKEPTADQIKCCRQNLLKNIEEVKPKLIICLGAPAMNAVLNSRSLETFKSGQMHGKVIPCHEHNCWVGCLYHPAFFLHRKNNYQNPNDENLMAFGLANIIDIIDQPLPQPLTEEGNECITDVDEAIAALEYFSDSEKPVSYDYEGPVLDPYDPKAEILSVALSNDISSGTFIPIGLKYEKTGEYVFNLDERTRILIALANFVKSDAPKIVQNLNLEEMWNRILLSTRMNNFIHDTMIAAHVLNCNQKKSLDYMVYEMTGHEYKDMVDVTNMINEPMEKVFHYNCWDARYTLMLYYKQVVLLPQEGKLEEFNSFLIRGFQGLINLRETGVDINTKVLDELEGMYSTEQKQRINEIQNCPGIKRFVEQKREVLKQKNAKEKEIEKANFNPDSPIQLAKVLYDDYKIKLYKKTKTKKGSTDAEALQIIEKNTDNIEVKSLISSLFRFRKTCSMLERIANYRRVMDSNHCVHPTYHLFPKTYRSGAGDPNIQNVFQRDDELRCFRKCIVPSPGRIFLDVDYSGIEVRVIAMASGDANLIYQIIESEKWDIAHPEGGPNPFDFHRRWAAELFRKDYKIIDKKTERYASKNGFVFPSFYMSVPSSMARYDAFVKARVTENHLEKVQGLFWEEYKDVRAWQKEIIATYISCGYVEGISGFRRYGPLTINQLANTPIQGPSFHLSLDSIDEIGKELERRGLKTRPCFEVHDSIMFNAVPEEKDEVIDLVEKIMLSKRFDWQLNVPLAVEWEWSDTNWYEMKKLVIQR